MNDRGEPSKGGQPQRSTSNGTERNNPMTRGKQRTMAERAAVAMIAAIASVSVADDGGYEIRSSVITGGGEPATDASYELRGTAGQHDVGVSAGDGLTIRGGFWPRLQPGGCPGDANGDGLVDGGDLLLIVNNFNTPASSPGEGDLSGDGIVDGADLLAVINAFGSGC